MIGLKLVVFMEFKTVHAFEVNSFLEFIFLMNDQNNVALTCSQDYGKYELEVTFWFKEQTDTAAGIKTLCSEKKLQQAEE